MSFLRCKELKQFSIYMRQYDSILSFVCRYLYSLLLDDVLSGSVRSVLIACTKQDQPLAKGIKVIRSQLEKEMYVHPF